MTILRKRGFRPWTEVIRRIFTFGNFFVHSLGPLANNSDRCLGRVQPRDRLYRIMKPAAPIRLPQFSQHYEAVMVFPPQRYCGFRQHHPNHHSQRAAQSKQFPSALLYWPIPQGQRVECIPLLPVEIYGWPRANSPRDQVRAVVDKQMQYFWWFVPIRLGSLSACGFRERLRSSE